MTSKFYNGLILLAPKKNVKFLKDLKVLKIFGQLLFTAWRFICNICRSQYT